MAKLIQHDPEQVEGLLVYAFGHCAALIFPETSLLLVALGHISKQGSLRTLSSSGRGGRTPNLNCQISCPTRKKRERLNQKGTNVYSLLFPFERFMKDQW